MEYIKIKILDYIKEATVENDKYYYDEAVKFYNDMLVELKNGNYINQKDGNVLFKGKSIDYKYYNLLILFTNNIGIKRINNDVIKNVGGGFGTTGDYSVIILNTLDDDKNPVKNLDRKVFIHEFIHYLDYVRSDGYKHKKTTTLTQYYIECD